MAVALAPFFIPTLMFKATSNLFESWVRFTLGFAMIPLVMAGVIGAIVGIGEGMISEATDATALADAAGFIIVGAGAVFLTFQVPTLVNSLSGTITATANGNGDDEWAPPVWERAAGCCGRHGGERPSGTMWQPPISRSATRWLRLAATRRPAAEMRSKPATRKRQRQKEIRQKYARKSAAFAATHGTHASAADRFAAANAGQRLENRNARQDRAARLSSAGAAPSRKRKAD